MTIQRILRTTFAAFTAAILLAVLLCCFMFYRERTRHILRNDYELIRNETLAGLSAAFPDHSSYTPDQVEAILSPALEESNYEYRIMESGDPIVAALLSSAGTVPDLVKNGTIRTSVNGVNRNCGYFLIPGSGRYVLLFPHSVRAVAFVGWRILILTLCILAVLFFLILFAANHFSQSITRPLDSLLSAIQEAADGNLDVRCETGSKNEIGGLARNFNKMLHIIQSNYDDLTEMRDQITANEEELRRNYDHIEFLAYHDVLTQLPNKLAFYDMVYSTLNDKHAASHMHAFYFVDLDNFKTINDTLGHDYGDELLTQTAAKLLEMLKSEDILSRAGGDEFLIFRANITSREDACRLGEQILEKFKAPFDLNGEIVHISMSIGISIYPLNGLSHTVLIKNADIAMYHSKDTGKNKLTLFTSQMEEQLQRETEVLDVLRHALSKNEVYLVYQPQFCSSDGSIAGFEALMRINSEKLGPLSPAEFIPIAESNGLIYDFGLWAMREACTMNQKLLARGCSPRTVSVNISSLQLNREGFFDTLNDILTETGLPPELLEVELTESMLVSSLTDAAAKLSELRSLGVHIALDDFGTGYSSLNYLTKMPINTLKIDKSFIDHISENERDSRLAESIISLAHGLNIAVVAEGVETNEQLSLLRSKQCDLIQGYLLGRPLLPEQLLLLLD